MNSATIVSLYERDLNKVITEIALYKKEENMWLVEKGIANSAGNLALHLIGNLHTFIGKEIGKTNYVRNRDLEFSQKDVSRASLILELENTILMIKDSLSALTDTDLQADYPFPKFAESSSNEYLLMHLLIHLSYHLGQINYHRRLLDA